MEGAAISFVMKEENKRSDTIGDWWRRMAE